MEEEKLIQTRNLINFIGDLLGDQYEIVFHVITEKEVYIDTIINGHISGRNENSPLTNLALDFIENKVYLERDYVMDYKAVTKDQRNLQGSTYFIKGLDDELLGMICVNYDYTKRVELAKDIFQSLNLALLDTVPAFEEKVTKNTSPQIFVEKISENIEDIIQEYVNIDISNNNIDLTQEAKVEIVEILEEKNIFQLKGAVSEVAKLLRVSEPTIYRYRKIANN